MQRIQRGNQIFSAPGSVIRLTYRNIQRKFMEERLQIRTDFSASLLLDISAAVRQHFCLIDIPNFFQICLDLFGKLFFSIYPHPDITGRRMNLSHLRIFIHIRTFLIMYQIPEFTTFFSRSNTAEIGDILITFVRKEHHILTCDSQFFCDDILNRIKLLQIADRKVIPFIRIIGLQIMIRRCCTVLIKPLGLPFRKKRFEINLNLCRIYLCSFRNDNFFHPRKSLLVSTDQLRLFQHCSFFFKMFRYICNDPAAHFFVLTERAFDSDPISASDAWIDLLFQNLCKCIHFPRKLIYFFIDLAAGFIIVKYRIRELFFLLIGNLRRSIQFICSRLRLLIRAQIGELSVCISQSEIIRHIHQHIPPASPCIDNREFLTDKGGQLLQFFAASSYIQANRILFLLHCHLCTLGIFKHDRIPLIGLICKDLALIGSGLHSQTKCNVTRRRDHRQIRFLGQDYPNIQLVRQKVIILIFQELPGSKQSLKTFLLSEISIKNRSFFLCRQISFRCCFGFQSP